MSIPFFGEVVSRHGVQPNLQKVRALTEMHGVQKQKGTAGFPRQN